MTRISQPPPTDAAHFDQAHAAEQTRGTGSNARFATLYRGTTRFAHSQTPSGNTSASLRTARLQALQAAARRRAAARRAAARRAGASGNGEFTDAGDGLEHDAPSGARKRVTFGGDSGDRGNNSGGQSHDGHDGHGTSEGNREPNADLKLRSLPGAPPAASLPPSKLQAVAAAHESASERDAAMRENWCNLMLERRDALAANPKAKIDAQLHADFVDLLKVQKHYGAAAPQGMAACRERLIEADRLRRAGATAPVQTSPASAERGELDRVQRWNLIMPLALFAFERPTPDSQREPAIARRRAQYGDSVAHSKRDFGLAA
ncbi:hypothetical protein [Paraburkholderia sediminicola]|uniref:hypothetical protein n=1 Tax=Paraburkholderia sediminicola TaxID=458836 RepID=UPI0038BCBB6D